MDVVLISYYPNINKSTWKTQLAFQTNVLWNDWEFYCYNRYNNTLFNLLRREGIMKFNCYVAVALAGLSLAIFFPTIPLAFVYELFMDIFLNIRFESSSCILMLSFLVHYILIFLFFTIVFFKYRRKLVKG